MWTLLIYLIGSFYAFMLVLQMYSNEYNNEIPELNELKRDYPEAIIIFCFATLTSWLYVILYIVANISNKYRK